MARRTPLSRRPSRAPTLLSEFESLLYDSYSPSLGMGEFIEIIRTGDGKAGPSPFERDDDILVEALLQDRKRLHRILTAMQGRVDAKTARMLIKPAAPVTYADRKMNVLYTLVWRDLRLSATGRTYVVKAPKGALPGLLLAAKLSRALDKVLIFLDELGLASERDLRHGVRTIVRLLEDKINMRAIGGNTSGEAMARYEEYAITCLSQFRRVLMAAGLRTHAQYLVALGLGDLNAGD